MSNSNIFTKFQLDIFIFEGLATGQALLQPQEQNSYWSAHSGRNFLAVLEQNAFSETMILKHVIEAKWQDDGSILTLASYPLVTLSSLQLSIQMLNSLDKISTLTPMRYVFIFIQHLNIFDDLTIVSLERFAARNALCQQTQELSQRSS